MRNVDLNAYQRGPVAYFLKNLFFLPIPLVKQENYFHGKGKPTQPATGVVKKACVFYLLFLSSRSRQSLARLFSILVLRICSRQQAQMPAKLKCKEMKFYWRPLELKTRTGFNLRFFCVFLKKKDTPESFIVLFIHQKS